MLNQNKEQKAGRKAVSSKIGAGLFVVNSIFCLYLFLNGERHYLFFGTILFVPIYFVIIILQMWQKYSAGVLVGVLIIVHILYCLYLFISHSEYYFVIESILFFEPIYIIVILLYREFRAIKHNKVLFVIFTLLMPFPIIVFLFRRYWLMAITVTLVAGGKSCMIPPNKGYCDVFNASLDDGPGDGTLEHFALLRTLNKPEGSDKSSIAKSIGFDGNGLNNVIIIDQKHVIVKYID